MPTRPPAQIKTPVCTCMQLRKASRLLSQIYDRSLEPYDLTVTQYGLLSSLQKRDGVSIGMLAEVQITDPTTLTRNLRPLVRRGLVEIKPDRRDKRSRCLHLTASGKEALANAKPAWRHAQLHIEKVLGGEHAPILHAALDHVLERFAE